MRIPQAFLQHLLHPSESLDVYKRQDLDEAVATLEEHQARLGYKEIHSERNVAKLSIVGAGMMSNPGVAAKMFESLYNEGVNINTVSYTHLDVYKRQVTECYNTCFVVQNGKQHLLVDGGGGNTLLAQLKHAGFNWMDMREIFVTHKHVDHLMGIVWMIRMICQYMRQGQYQGEAWIYGHDEVIAILKEMADRLLSGKETCFIGNRLHMDCLLYTS